MIFDPLAALDSATEEFRRQLLAVGDEFFDALGYAPTFRFEGPVDSGVPDALAAHVVAVVREGLANVAKHAGSPTAEVRVSVANHEVKVFLDDARVPPRSLSHPAVIVPIEDEFRVLRGARSGSRR